MKKAGSSNSKSKTRPSSRSSAARPTKSGSAPVKSGALTASVAAPLAVGHAPAKGLAPVDTALFRAFQSNFLSLISHELRTPLMGVLNALTLLDEGSPTAEFTTTEMIAMARQNAQRLHRALVTLLDLAGIESGTFHARLKEVALGRLLRNRILAHEKAFREKGLSFASNSENFADTPVLGDPQKLGRAIDLCFELAMARAPRQSAVKVRLSSIGVNIDFGLPPGTEATWEAAWSQGIAAFEGGIGSPTSAFSGVLQSEQAFLSRAEEGLGSEFLLIHEIMRLHHGRFQARRSGLEVALSLELSMPTSEETLRSVLLSRAYEVSTELGSVALALVRVPEGENADTFRTKMKRSLFRSSDGVYALFERGLVALVLDDCKAGDAPQLLKRLEKTLGCTLKSGIAHCPEDRLDPVELIGLAESRLPG